MSKWWYYSIAKCPHCGATDERYDHTAPWCDSGLSSSPVFDEVCDECFADLQDADDEGAA